MGESEDTSRMSQLGAELSRRLNSGELGLPEVAHVLATVVTEITKSAIAINEIKEKLNPTGTLSVLEDLAAGLLKLNDDMAAVVSLVLDMDQRLKKLEKSEVGRARDGKR